MVIWSYIKASEMAFADFSTSPELKMDFFFANERKMLAHKEDKTVVNTF